MDDRTIQMSNLFESRSYDPGESDKEHDSQALEEVRSLSDRSSSHPPSEKSEITFEDDIEPPKHPVEEESSYNYEKKAKKSKLASKRAIFEEE